MSDIAKAEVEVAYRMRLWHMASPEKKNEAYVRLLAAQEWLEVVEEVHKDSATVARQHNNTAP